MKLAFIFVFHALMTPVLAQLHIGVGINIGPPVPVRDEVVIARPYNDAIWIPGYYQWRPKHHRYAWVKGHWGRPPHAHMMWVPGRWELRNKEWVFYQGRWDKEMPVRR